MNNFAKDRVSMQFKQRSSAGNCSAFTLVELLVVISIIALLLAILMPSLQKAREQAKKVVCGSNLHQIGLGLAAYCADHSDTLPAVYFWSTGTQMMWYPDTNQQMSVLYYLKYLPTEKLFYSPCDKGRKADAVGEFHHWTGNLDVDNRQSWQAVRENETVHYLLTYSYQQVLPIVKSPMDIGPFYLKLSKVKVLAADRFCYGNMWSFHGGDETLTYTNAPIIPFNGKGWHIAMADGSVRWEDNDREIFDYMEDERRALGTSVHFWVRGQWFDYWGKH